MAWQMRESPCHSLLSCRLPCINASYQPSIAHMQAPTAALTVGKLLGTTCAFRKATARSVGIASIMSTICGRRADRQAGGARCWRRHRRFSASDKLQRQTMPVQGGPKPESTQRMHLSHAEVSGEWGRAAADIQRRRGLLRGCSSVRGSKQSS